MFNRLLFPVLLLGALTSAAQTAPAAVAPTTTATYGTASDTIQAVHQLFSQRRTGGWIWTGIGAAFAARILTAGASAGNAGGTVVGTAVLGGGPAAIGIGKLTRFSAAKEEMTVADYQKSRHLPHYVSRRLKKKYFNT